MQPDDTILWTRNDRPGHEYARLSADEAGWRLSGVALFEHDGLPCNLSYAVRCDRSWVTTEAEVTGRVGPREVDVSLIADAARVWRLNGEICAAVTGAIDVDLNFSPSTNLLPIRRLNLAVRERSEICAAWLRFPGFTLEPLVQSYTRTSEQTYVYESGGGTFVAELQIGKAGWPLSYGNIWSAAAFL